MYLTVTCYLEQKGQWLMLHRIKKDHDINQGKWIGIGGKLEAGESPEECLLREVREETGLSLTSFRLRGMVTFNFTGPKALPGWETEYMYVYTADGWEGELTDCPEGETAWVPVEEVPRLNLWPGDRLFLEKIWADEPFFSYKIVYEGDRILSCQLDGRPVDL